MSATEAIAETHRQRIIAALERHSLNHFNTSGITCSCGTVLLPNQRGSYSTLDPRILRHQADAILATLETARCPALAPDGTPCSRYAQGHAGGHYWPVTP